MTVAMANTYPATIERWVDGDTVWVNLDLGFRMSVRLDLRLYGVDTPERGTSGYHEAIAFVNRLAPVGSSVNLRTYKNPDKYGRWLAEVITPESRLVNDELVGAGLAVAYFGGKK